MICQDSVPLSAVESLAGWTERQAGTRFKDTFNLRSIHGDTSFLVLTQSMMAATAWSMYMQIKFMMCKSVSW